MQLFSAVLAALSASAGTWFAVVRHPELGPEVLRGQKVAAPAAPAEATACDFSHHEGLVQELRTSVEYRERQVAELQVILEAVIYNQSSSEEPAAAPGAAAPDSARAAGPASDAAPVLEALRHGIPSAAGAAGGGVAAELVDAAGRLAALFASVVGHFSHQAFAYADGTVLPWIATRAADATSGLTCEGFIPGRWEDSQLLRQGCAQLRGAGAAIGSSLEDVRSVAEGLAQLAEELRPQLLDRLGDASSSAAAAAAELRSNAAAFLRDSCGEHCTAAREYLHIYWQGFKEAHPEHAASIGDLEPLPALLVLAIFGGAALRELLTLVRFARGVLGAVARVARAACCCWCRRGRTARTPSVLHNKGKAKRAPTPKAEKEADKDKDARSTLQPRAAYASWGGC